MKNRISFPAILLLFLTSLSMSGCLKDDGSNTEYPDVTASADTIFGTLKYNYSLSAKDSVVGWPFGTATFKAVVGVDHVLASAAVNADGTFVLVLPATVSGSYLTALTDVANTQGGSIAATPETVRFLNTIQYKIEYTDKGQPASIFTNLYVLNEDNTIEKSYFFNFYDSAGNFAGTGTAGNVFNWTFEKGWGKIESTILNSSSRTFSSKSINEIPAGAVWVNF